MDVDGRSKSWTGVTLISNNTWKATCTRDGKTVTLGTFGTRWKAHCAVSQAMESDGHHARSMQYVERASRRGDAPCKEIDSKELAMLRSHEWMERTEAPL